MHPGVVSQHALQVVSQHALQVSRGVVSQHAMQLFRPKPKGEVEGSGPGGSPCPHPGGVGLAHTQGEVGIPACTELRAVGILLECILVLNCFTNILCSPLRIQETALSGIDLNQMFLNVSYPKSSLLTSSMHYAAVNLKTVSTL